MSSQLSEQFDVINSMLAAGHRSVHLERHSLLLWGGVGGVLCVGTQAVVTAERFPDISHRAVALLVWLGFWLGGTGWLDIRLTRRARYDREETLPFAQAQITRAWWMLLTMGALVSFAMFFYGGAVMIYALWIVLLGLGVYLFGLFSRPLIEWMGLATILLGIIGLASGLSFGTTRWLAASCFAVGLPMAGWLASRTDDRRIGLRCVALSIWLLAVALPPLVLAKTLQSTTSVPDVPKIPPEVYVPMKGVQVLSIPANTTISIRVDLDSNLIGIPKKAELPLVLNRPLDVEMQDGKPEGHYRVNGGSWHQVSDGLMQLRIDQFRPSIEAGKLLIRTHAVFDVSN